MVGLPILKDFGGHLAWCPVTVSFFIPSQYLPDPDRREAWKSGSALAPSGKEATAQAWIFQTALELESSMPSVSLVSELPSHGVVVALSGNLPPGLPATPGRFLLDVVADGCPHPSAQLHICQNPLQARHLPNAVFIPHWPQPGLIPRDPSRRDLWENVRFYGDAANLDPGIADPGFAHHLKESLDLDFGVVDVAAWHDYSQTDCVLAVRRPGIHPHKPATKLYNAWLAGVPFLGGKESAFLEEGRPGVDFLAVTDATGALAALELLATSPTTRNQLVENGFAAAINRSPHATASRWHSLLTDGIAAKSSRWMSRSRPACHFFSAWSRMRLAIAQSTLRTG
jgi:hypothetical protein